MRSRCWAAPRVKRSPLVARVGRLLHFCYPRPIARGIREENANFLANALIANVDNQCGLRTYPQKYPHKTWISPRLRYSVFSLLRALWIRYAEIDVLTLFIGGDAEGIVEDSHVVNRCHLLCVLSSHVQGDFQRSSTSRRNWNDLGIGVKVTK